MIVTVTRIISRKNDTIGFITVQDSPLKEKVHYGFTLEDEYREEKVMKETRIPEGTYELGIQELNTGLTQKYQKKYPWFKKHLHIKNVPNFTGVYIHIGNTEKHTAGCLLIGNTIALNMGKDAFLGQSTDTFKKFYEKLYPFLESGGKAIIKYIDL